MKLKESAAQLGAQPKCIGRQKRFMGCHARMGRDAMHHGIPIAFHQPMDIESLPKVQCPRCKRLWPDCYFQEPITLCLICYSTIRENRDLDPSDPEFVPKLALRARNSRAGKMKRRVLERDESLADFYRSRGVIPPPTRDSQSPGVEQPTDCTRCEAIFDGRRAEMFKDAFGIVQIFCPTCFGEYGKVMHVRASQAPAPTVSEDEIFNPKPPPPKPGG